MKRSYRWDPELKKLVEFEKRDPGPKVYIIGDIEPYLDDNMAHNPIHVKSRQHRTQLLKEKGLAIL